MAVQTNDTAFVITHLLDAPREQVFKAWSEAECLSQWWGPKGVSLKVNKLVFKPGGVFQYLMEMPDGSNMWGKFHYMEIIQPERMVYLSSFSDAEEGVTRHPMAPDWPLETLSTLTLTEQDGKTLLRLEAIPYNATESEKQIFEASHNSMRQGFGVTLNQLEAYLKNR